MASIMKAFNKAAKKIGDGFKRLSHFFFGMPVEELGAAAKDPALFGQTQTAALYGGENIYPLLTIEGGALQAGHRYRFSGSLRIKGDVPENTAITVEDGWLEISGNVGDKCRLSADLPVLSHQQSHTVLMPMLIGKTTVLMPMTVTDTIIDGLKYPQDKKPAITVKGWIGNEVAAHANAGIDAGGWGVKFDAKTGYDRPLRQTAHPAGPRPKTVPPRKAA